MKKIFFILPALLLIYGCKSNDFSVIERGFVSPPDNVRTAVYWYWINDNISKEGVVKDLHAMKQAGINRAFIGNIGKQGASYGNIKIFSDEWWDVLHTALKTATELDIEIGIFNSPGWSQSGGPWIKPEQAMRYLASSETRVKGLQKLTLKLAQPTESFQDVKTLAFPVEQDYQENLFQLPGAKTVLSDNKIITQEGKYLLPKDVDSYIGIILPQAATARSLTIYPGSKINADCELQAKEGDTFRTVKKFNANRTNAALRVGFEPYAPVVVSFPDVTAVEFRLVFSNTLDGSNIKSVVLSSAPLVERYPEKSFAKMLQTPLPYWHDYLWDAQTDDPAASIDPKQVRDISQYLASDGTLTWDVPEGEWLIMRFGMAPTGMTNAPTSPEGTGLEVDKMSKQHVTAHFDGYLGEIIRRIPAADRKSWKVIVADSYEASSQNFTDGMLDEFRQRYGYDPVPFLPVFKGHVVGSPDLSDRFLWDVRRLVADKLSYDYVGGLRDVGHQYGLTTWLENYGHWGFIGEFLQYGGQSDEIGGEFWCEGDLGDIENRAASSCAHIYGKTKVWAESLTSSGNSYGRYPKMLKRRLDWSFTEGINSTLLHVNIQQPDEINYPGINAWFGVEFNRKNTWFSQMDLFTQYIKRCNFMLQQGLDVADVAYYIGDDTPKMTGVRDPELPGGYSFDYINNEVIIRDLSVKDGRLTLPHGTSYRLLVLPKLETMRPEVLQKIEQLVADGAVVLGLPPNRSPSMQGYPEADKQVQVLAAKMWGDLSVKQRAYGKGTILTDMTMKEAFDLLNIVPDCRFADGDPALYAHRTVNGSDIYFISNQSENTIRISPQFRVSGKQPELWNSADGSIRPLSAFVQDGEITSVPLQLEPLESVFVVFRKEGKPSATNLEANYPNLQVVATIDSPWEVRFESDEIRRGPSEPVTFISLQDWSKHEDERIRYYSGTAVYKNHITVGLPDKSRTVFLDLGNLTAMAKVKINGQYADGVWTAPYRVNISKYLVEGDNVIEVEVVNTWVNRMIGDLRLPVEERHVSPQNNTWRADSPLQPSGLLGPVKLEIRN
jgi:hypothetical protein